MRSMKYSARKWLKFVDHTISFNPFKPRQNGRHFPDDIFKCIFLNENVPISITISPKFVPKGLINNIPAMVQIKVWRRPGDKPLSEPLMIILPMHICVTRPQWVYSVLHLFSELSGTALPWVMGSHSRDRSFQMPTWIFNTCVHYCD